MRLLAQARLGVDEPNETPNDLIFYNCMTMMADRPGFLWQTLVVAGSGCGVGLSTEKYIKRHGKRTPVLMALPKVKKSVDISAGQKMERKVLDAYPDCEFCSYQDRDLWWKFVVEDSLEGWGRAVQVATWLAWSGHDRPDFFDYSRLREKGAPLRRRGGYSSGPDPLRELIKAIYEVCAKARGRRLKSTEVHYLYTMVGEAIVCGGVRRMAAITTSDVRDLGMRSYKDFLHPGAEPENKLGLRLPPRASHVSNNTAAILPSTTEYELRNELEHTFWSRCGEQVGKVMMEQLGQESVVDRHGNMCSVTQTLLSIFGSRVVSPSTGLLLNNGIMWFDPEPGKPNSLAPNKRCLANYNPVIGEDAAGRRFAIGASGGRKILGSVMQLSSFIMDHGLSLEDAFHQPRIDVSGGGQITVDRSLAPHFPCGCGLSGCLDTVGGARGIERLHRHLQGTEATAEAVVRAWLSGDAAAGKTIDLWAALLAPPLAMILNTVGASIVPVGGGLSNVPALIAHLDEAVRAMILRHTDRPLVVPALCTIEPGLIGAAAAAEVAFG